MAPLYRIATSRALFGASVVAAFVIASPAFAQSGHALGFDTTNFDHSVRPQDDFFRYVNGGWLKTAEIPADASSWGAFQELRENSRNALHRALRRARARRTRRRAAPSARSAICTRATWTARASRSSALTPLQPELKTIAALQLRAAAARHLRALRATRRAGTDRGVRRRGSEALERQHRPGHAVRARACPIATTI